MKRITCCISVILCLLIFISLPVIAQDITFKGRVVSLENGKEITMPAANVSIYSKDSIFLKGDITDTKGFFSIGVGKDLFSYMKVSFMGYEPAILILPETQDKTKDLGKIQLVPQIEQIDEVTVVANNKVRKLDRILVYPSKLQIEKSADGIELLRNLHLRGIEVKRSDNSVEGIRGGSVRLQINGASASIKDIMAINPEDVIRIEHIDEPSLRYEGSEAVINYIVKRRESGGSVMLSANHAITTKWGEDFMNFKLNHKRSELSFIYNLTYKKTKSYQDSHERFTLGDDDIIDRYEEGRWGLYNEKTHYMSTSYSLLEVDKYLFLVSASYSKSGLPNNDASGLLRSNFDGKNALNKIDLSSSDVQIPSANIYYQRNLTKNQLLVFDLTGTYIGTEQKRTYQEFLKEQELAHIFSEVNGKRYSTIGEVAYENTLKVGRLSVGLKQSYSYTNNRYLGDIISSLKMKQLYTHFYSEWFGKVKSGITYSIGLGGMYSHTTQGNITRNKWLFTPTFRFGYKFNDRTELRYEGKLSEQSPSLGDMNDVEQALDTLQIRKGNPLLLPFTSYTNSLNFSTVFNNFNFFLDISDCYSPDQIMESVYVRDNNIIRTMENQKYWHNVLTTANLAYGSDNFYIYARGGLNWIDSKGIDYHHYLRNWFYKFGFEGSWKKWTFYSEIGNGRTSLIGETLSERDKSAYVGLSYRVKRVYLNAIAFFSLHKWTSKDVNHNKSAFQEKYFYTNNRNMVMLKAIWSFQFGRKVNQKNKRINNSDSESGILNIR